MRIDLKNIASVLIDKYIIILFLIFALTVLSGLGLSNFKLDASSDALVLENDESLKTYRAVSYTHLTLPTIREV